VASCFSGEIQSFGKDRSMFSKILLALGVVLAISALGSARKCNQCEYWTSQPKEQQTCTGSGTVDCPSGYCSTGFATYDNGTDVIDRRCVTIMAQCADPEEFCSNVTTRYNLKACIYKCCSTDNCNNYTVGSATGVKFTLSLMVIVEAGGDSTTGYFPGKWDHIGTKHKVYGKTVKDLVMADICQYWRCSGRIKTKRQHVQARDQGELNLIEAMKTQNPSVSYKVIKENVLLHGNLPTGTSTTAISRAVRLSMLQGKMTWKRLSRANDNKFTDENIDCFQDFLDYMSQVDPYRLKFFDESGVELQDCNKHYGHSVINTPCVEVGKYPHSRNITLNLLVGLEGILHANTINGSADTFDFLNFFDEASKNFQRNGNPLNPVLTNGDIIVMDNCAIHHNAGGFALWHWLDTMGIDVVYLPTYSPELNPVELVFNKLKIVLKREEMQPVVRVNLHAYLWHADCCNIQCNMFVQFNRNIHSI
ncbi:Hypothetical predicted protein, partial [Paramuricea clavata]